MKQVIIDSDGKQCRPIYPECMFVDSTPRKGSMNPISSDAVFNVVGGSTELPSYDESNEGQILKVKDDASGVEWADVPSGIPDMTGQDGKILGAVDVEGTMEAQWINPPEELPSVTGNAGKILTVNSGATGVEWADAPTEIPTVTGNAGKVLTVNAGATSVEWADAPAELPSVSGNANKILTVNSGATGVEWVDAPTEIPSVTGNANKILTVNAGATGVEWASAPAELPTVTGNAGKVLKVNAGATGVEWATDNTVTVDQTYSASSTNPQSGTAVAGALANINQVPASTSADENKVLTVDSNGGTTWATPAQTTYTASTGIDITSNVISADIDNSTIKTALAPSVIQSARNLIQLSSGYGAFEINSDVKAKLTQDSSANGSKLKIHIPGNVFSFTGDVTSGQDSSVYVQLCSDQYFNPGNSTALFPVALTNTYNSQTQKTYIDDQDVEISCYMADWLSGSSGSPLAPTTLNPATSSSSSHWFMGFFRGDGTHTSTQVYAASSASLPPNYPVVISEYVAGNKLCVNLPSLTTAGISDIQLVNALPASPVATVLYLIPET